MIAKQEAPKQEAPRKGLIERAKDYAGNIANLAKEGKFAEAGREIYDIPGEIAEEIPVVGEAVKTLRVGATGTVGGIVRGVWNERGERVVRHAGFASRCEEAVGYNIRGM
jgi:hypothetical protein